MPREPQTLVERSRNEVHETTRVGVACGYLRSMAEAELFVSGCYKHKSQWHLRHNPALPLMTFSADAAHTTVP